MFRKRLIGGIMLIIGSSILWYLTDGAVMPLITGLLLIFGWDLIEGK